MAKVTETELKKLIQEEIDELEEGWRDRLKARASGRFAQAGALGSNIKKGVGDVMRKAVGGSDEFEPSRRANTRKIRRLEGAKSIINAYAKRVDTLNTEMEKDFEKLEAVGIQTSGFKSIMEKLGDALEKLNAQVVQTGKTIAQEKG